jgi:hypothetical protein
VLPLKLPKISLWLRHRRSHQRPLWYWAEMSGQRKRKKTIKRKCLARNRESIAELYYARASHIGDDHLRTLFRHRHALAPGETNVLPTASRASETDFLDLNQGRSIKSDVSMADGGAG